MRLKYALLALTLQSALLSADVNDDVFSADDTSTFDLSPGGRDEYQGPFTLRSSFDFVGSADFTKQGYKDKNLKFSEYDIDASYVFYYNPCRKEGLGIELGYSHYHLDFQDNPFFNEDNFNVVSAGVSFFTARAWRWDWKGFAKLNMNAGHMDVQRYSTWDLMVWGRFELATDWGLHTGALVLTGMKLDRVYPIIGLDWIANDCWKVSAVFPLNFSIIYTPNCNWAFALQSRFWDVRQRVGYTEPLSRCIWEYRNAGAEFAINYIYGGLTVNAHAGYTFGGQLKIYNRNKTHPRKLDLEAAPYAGGEIAYNF